MYLEVLFAIFLCV